MPSQQLQSELPEELLREIDAEVGSESRSVFLVETLQAELRKRRLLAFLARKEPAWKEENHPELAEGAAAWVGSLRDDREWRATDAQHAKAPAA